MYGVHYRFNYNILSHVAMLHFVHALCALVMLLVYKSHFTNSHDLMLEIQSGLQDCLIRRLATL